MKRQRIVATLSALFFIMSLGMFFVPNNAEAESKDSIYGDEMKALEIRHKEEMNVMKQRQKEEKEALKKRYKHADRERHGYDDSDHGGKKDDDRDDRYKHDDDRHDDMMKDREKGMKKKY
ncbi:MAG: hypothetical protein JSV11_03785 [Nitrospiraceae bacterium]|nr:MAG: hypothetical protein JSV11_03785 [Nitrospiraceae bacterium]